MQNRDDVDGSQRPTTADAPNLSTPASGHLGPAGDPVEGAPATGPRTTGSAAPAADDSDHLGPAGDPVEGAEAAVDIDLNSPPKE
jgi:hypothetical protein